MSEINMPNDKAPSNSHRYNTEQQTDIQPVVKSKVVVKKQSGLQKFAKSFLAEDAKSIGDYVLNDIIMRSIKDTFFDMVTNGLRMALFGDARPNNRNRTTVGSKYSYNSILDGPRTKGYSRGERIWNFDELIIPNREEAEGVIAQLFDILERYERVRVADFYTLLGLDYEYTDNDYGWTRLENSYVKHVRDGYVVVLPKPVPLSRNRLG